MNVLKSLIYLSVPFSYVQESARWLVTKRRYGAAEEVIYTIAKFNGKPKPDTRKIMEEAAKSDSGKTSVHYSVLDLFKTKDMIKITSGLLFIWCALYLI